jgi:peptidoglycan hydrolase-like protein with peptidoglycan-binding domain
MCLLALATGAAADTGGASVGAAGGASTSTAVAKPPAAATFRLARGAHGHRVRVLQDLLTRAGLPTPLAGIFGPQTERNVKHFQRAHRLRADGVVTARVLAALKHAARGPAPVAAPVPPTSPTTGPPIPAPTATAMLRADGTAVAPPGAPAEIRALIAAANRIASTPYLWGGGHGRWEDTGYDCSGSVSYALHGGGLLDATMDSGGLMTYGDPGPGSWIAIYANADHVYMVVAGLRYDTSGAKPSRWQSTMRSGDGFTVRHPTGW